MAENIFASAFSPVEEKETQVSEGNVFSSAFKSTPVGSDVDLENFIARTKRGGCSLCKRPLGL